MRFAIPALFASFVLFALFGCAEDWGELPTNGQGSSSKRKASSNYQKHSAALEAAKPFLSTTVSTTADGTHVPVVSFNAAAARYFGLDNESVDFVERIVSNTNTVTSQAQDPEPLLPVFGQEVSDFFSEHAELQAEVWAEYNEEGMGGGDYMTHEQALTPSWCGGTWLFPAVCGDWTHHAQEWNSEQEVIDHLFANNFHRTAWYATRSPYDYTKPVTWPCGTVYRIQALIERRKDKWSYREQHDLNPEVIDWPVVPWPVSWWGAYVMWWHHYHC